MLENLNTFNVDPKEKDGLDEENKKELYSGGQDMHDTDSAYDTDNDGSEYDSITKSSSKNIDTNPWGDDED